MKQNFLFIVLIIVTFIMQSGVGTVANTVLQGGVSKVEEVPDDFYGTWVVTAREISNPDHDLYASTSIDVWTLCRYGDIIVLSNPVSGASATITIDDVQGKTISFSRTSTSNEDGEIGHETPTLTIKENTFDGMDKIVIKKYRNNQLFREDTITYGLKGKKVASCNLFR